MSQEQYAVYFFLRRTCSLNNTHGYSTRRIYMEKKSWPHIIANAPQLHQEINIQQDCSYYIPRRCGTTKFRPPPNKLQIISIKFKYPLN